MVKLNVEASLNVNFDSCRFLIVVFNIRSNILNRSNMVSSRRRRRNSFFLKGSSKRNQNLEVFKSALTCCLYATNLAYACNILQRCLYSRMLAFFRYLRAAQKCHQGGTVTQFGTSIRGRTGLEVKRIR